MNLVYVNFSKDPKLKQCLAIFDVSPDVEPSHKYEMMAIFVLHYFAAKKVYTALPNSHFSEIIEGNLASFSVAFQDGGYIPPLEMLRNTVIMFISCINDYVKKKPSHLSLASTVYDNAVFSKYFTEILSVISLSQDSADMHKKIEEAERHFLEKNLPTLDAFKINIDACLKDYHAKIKGIKLDTAESIYSFIAQLSVFSLQYVHGLVMDSFEIGSAQEEQYRNTLINSLKFLSDIEKIEKDCAPTLKEELFSSEAGAVTKKLLEILEKNNTKETMLRGLYSFYSVVHGLIYIHKSPEVKNIEVKKKIKNVLATSSYFNIVNFRNLGWQIFEPSVFTKKVNLQPSTEREKIELLMSVEEAIEGMWLAPVGFFIIQNKFQRFQLTNQAKKNTLQPVTAAAEPKGFTRDPRMARKTAPKSIDLLPVCRDISPTEKPSDERMEISLYQTLDCLPLQKLHREQEPERKSVDVALAQEARPLGSDSLLIKKELDWDKAYQPPMSFCAIEDFTLSTKNLQTLDMNIEYLLWMTRPKERPTLTANVTYRFPEKHASYPEYRSQVKAISEQLKQLFKKIPKRSSANTQMLHWLLCAFQLKLGLYLSDNSFFTRNNKGNFFSLWKNWLSALEKDADYSLDVFSFVHGIIIRHFSLLSTIATFSSEENRMHPFMQACQPYVQRTARIFMRDSALFTPPPTLLMNPHHKRKTEKDSAKKNIVPPNLPNRKNRPLPN